MNDPQPNFLDQLQADPVAAVAIFYAGCLRASTKAIALVTEELGLTIEQAQAQQIGFADRTLGKQIPSARIKAGRIIRERLKELNIFKANGRETLRGYVTVPIRNEAGDIIGIRGHKVDKHSTGPETILVGAQASAAQPQLDDPPCSEPTPESAEACTPTEDLVIEDGQILFQRDDRRYRIRGLEKNTSVLTLKVNLMASRDGLVHMDTLDLVKARSRSSFIKATSTELFTDPDTVKKDIGTLLLKLETLQSDRIAELKKPKVSKVTMTDQEQSAALELLQSPSLLRRIVADMDACGIVGESTNKLAGYLAATSRKLDKPLAVVIQSSSSAGKTSLMDAVLSLMPPEDVQRFSGMTGQSLFYLDSDDIRHKILAIAEDEGIRRATYGLKLLQSDGKLRHATVGRGENGQSQTVDHEVEGPVQIFLTTTAMDIDEELVNRCFVLTVDESRGQTDAIQSLQRDARTEAIHQSKQVRKRIQSLHQNAQRLIRPLTVYNPFAPQLTFANEKTRLRRDHEKYLNLIETITLLHQHQREIHRATIDGQTIESIDVTRQDIAIANGIAGEVLGRSLDELAPQTRNLLGLLHEYVQSQVKTLSLPRDAVRFTRRDVREAIHWSDAQVRKHLHRLVELEYVLVHRGRNGQRYVYELLYAGEGREGQPFVMGLIDPAKLSEPASTTQTLTPGEATLTP